jgi:DNA-directed RNA polymerase specialized sigma24 family protein
MHRYNRNTNALQQRQQNQALADALRTLPSGHGQLLEARWLEERSWAELVTETQVQEGTLRVRAHRACQRLRRLLQNTLDKAA